MLRVTKITNEFFIVRDLDIPLGLKASRCTDCPHDVGDLYNRDCSHPDCLVSQNPQLNEARTEFIFELNQLTRAGEVVILIHEIADLVNFGADPDKIIDLTKSRTDMIPYLTNKLHTAKINSDFIKQIIATLASWEGWWDANFEMIHQSNIANSLGYSKPPVLRWDSKFYRQTADYYANQNK